MLANSFILLNLLFLLIFLIRKQYNTFLILYCITLTLFPPFRIGEVYINSSYFLFLIQPIWFFHNRSIKKKYSQIEVVYVLFHLCFIFLNILGWFVNGNSVTNSIIPFLGIVSNLFHIVFVMILVNRNNILVGNVIHKYIEWIVKLNFAAVICQALFPKIVFRFFMELYYQPSLEVYKHALEHFEAHGWIPRVFGWFGSPIDLGAIMLLCWAYFIHIIITNNKKGNIVLALMIIITGVSPLSKTFLIGAPIISLFYLLYIISNGISKRLFVKVAKFMIFTTSSFVLLYLILLQTFIGPYVKYYFKFIFDPLSSLSARYAAKGDELFLNTTYEVIKENWISGVGPSAIRGEFVGDSEYVTIIHNTGIIGFIIFLILIFFLIAKFIIKKNIMCMLVLIALLLVSIGGMTFYFSTICLPFIFFLLFNQQHKLLKTS